jgi:hypothetical protein
MLPGPLKPVLGAALLLLAAVPAATARTISWSGHTWNVRPSGTAAPGPNAWSDSDDNVRVEGDDLVLSIVRDASGTWTSAEIDNQRHLGYGTYRWVVASDLSALDAHEVLGMFTYGGASPSNNEIDIEAARWGDVAWPTGSATVWQDPAAELKRSRTFDYTDKPPYVNQFTWEPGRITYLITDATGATLLREVVTSGVPVPSTEVPMINYWRYRDVPPAGLRSVRISSFTWTPPGAESEQPWRCAIAKVAGAAVRHGTAGPRAAAMVTWTARADAVLRLAVSRRTAAGRVIPVTTLRRTVRAGRGRLRLTDRIAGHRLRSGRYRLALTVSAGPGDVRCGPKRVGLSVPAR